MAEIKSILSTLIYAFFPKRCSFCNNVISPSVDICNVCKKSIPYVKPPICMTCGRGKEECLCKGKQIFYTCLSAPFYYENEVKKCILNFKFYSKISNAKILANEMAKTARCNYGQKAFDIITYVPLTNESLKIRGYNQSLLLAVEVGKILKLKPPMNIISKIYDTPAQHTMNSSMRKGNLAGVFEITDPELVKDKTILLCDDIATTGATLNECAKMLVLSGAKEVCCLTAAVTRKNSIA